MAIDRETEVQEERDLPVIMGGASGKSRSVSPSDIMRQGLETGVLWARVGRVIP